MDREVTTEDERSTFRHRDREELTGACTFADLGSHQGDRLVDADLARRQDLRASAFHADAPATPAASSNVSRTWIGPSRATAWCSWIDIGTVGSPRSASMPRSAANAPGSVVMQGTPVAAAAVRISEPSVRGARPNGVLITRSTAPARINPATLSGSSETFDTRATGIPPAAGPPPSRGWEGCGTPDSPG